MLMKDRGYDNNTTHLVVVFTVWRICATNYCVLLYRLYIHTDSEGENESDYEHMSDVDEGIANANRIVSIHT